MEVYNGKYCVTYDDMAGTLSAQALKQAASRGRVEQARRACPGSPALFVVDTLPTKYRIEVYRRNPDLKAQAESREFIDTITPDGYAAQYYADYKIDGTRGLDYEKQMEYTNNASILAAFRDILSKSDSQHAKLSKPRVKRCEFWKRAAAALPRIADRFPNSLPENARRLQEKYNEFFRGGSPNYDVLISAKFANSNASKIVTPEQEAMIIKLLSDHRNFDNSQIAMVYNAVADKMGWKQVTAPAVKTWRKKYDLETAAGRLGNSEFYNQRSMQVKRSRPTAPLYMWSLDGWDVELLYQNTETKKDGRTVTTYSNRLTIEIVLDPFCNYPIGFAIGDQEDSALITAALRNAANHTAELFGRRYRSNQIQSDHFAMKAMMPIYGVVGDKVVPAKVKNAKSKPVERFFLSFNKMCQLLPNWAGFGITSDKNKQPNSDALNLIRKSFPTREECIMQVTKIVEAMRAMAREKYLAGWAKVAEERRLPLSDEQYLLTFGTETGYKNALEGSGLNIRLLGAKRSYDCFDMNFRKYPHIRWNIKYDPADLTKVLAVNEDGSLQFLLEEKYVQPMALADRKPGDAEQLARVREFNSQVLEPHVIKTITDASDKVAELFHKNPQLDMLRRVCLCDSEGQHKARRNQARLEAPEAQPQAEPVPVEIPAPEVPKRKVKTAELY